MNINIKRNNNHLFSRWVYVFHSKDGAPIFGFGTFKPTTELRGRLVFWLYNRGERPSKDTL